MKAKRIYENLLRGPLNIRFQDFCKVMRAFGYRLDRTSGSHHVFEHPGTTRPLSIQERHGQAKPYQIRQFLREVEEFHLTLEDHDE